jgi:L-seryl-tRNA(Ser) seleniumtransferase
MTSDKPASPYPSVDHLARLTEVESLISAHGRAAVVEAIRGVLERHRAARAQTGYPAPAGFTGPGDAQLATEVAEWLQRRGAPRLRRVFNLTGTILHSNLGRALLSEESVAQVNVAMREAGNLEFDLDSGKRGERDHLVEGLLVELTGAEAATVVNNNAGAVLLVLAALAQRREVLLSRGELVEIGGSFRVPDVMRSAGVRLVEVGTTNRTHGDDYEGAIGPSTAALMKVHASNYRVSGYVAQVDIAKVAAIAHARGLPLLVDLGAGSLVDLSAYGLPREPVVSDVIAAGGDVVTFSGDKLLGGPQAGLVVGRKVFIDRVRRHPLKRALRCCKLTLSALEATLLAYRRPDRLTTELPTLRLLTRPVGEIQALATRLLPQLTQALGASWQVSVVATASQVGSGSLPGEYLPSAALAVRANKTKAGAALRRLAARLRDLPVPVIGRIAEDQLLLDLRCLQDEAGFAAQLSVLAREVQAHG